jgi:hypothetical protein
MFGQTSAISSFVMLPQVDMTWARSAMGNERNLFTSIPTSLEFFTISGVGGPGRGADGIG